ncbi:MAG: tRNA (adenosine(37)-N6)-dimethylallyltransferase MiaA [Gammaproteobacteria bacterium]|nr:tRNA (adenosine(37)-N6)-dimethylallyltransferase MiaA [Gammaproteobacteria bacterium]
MDKAILLMGATATGKTDLAVKLVEKFPVEIISVDSALIYKTMDIGTAKPDAELLQRAPHYLIDIIDPAERWSAWDFVRQATNLISEINARVNIPLLVGGTMMYFNALEQGLNDLPMADEDLRQQLNQELQDDGLDSLYAQLSEIDPQTAARLKPTDPQRILRALEVYRLSGKPMSELLRQAQAKPSIEFKRLILDVPERLELHQRIEQRFQLMLEQGFEKEVKDLRKRADLNLQLPSMRCVGYRQMWMYLDGNYSYEEMVNRSVIATRQLAKRQLTWLRKYEDVMRVDYRAYSFDEICRYLNLKNSTE